MTQPAPTHIAFEGSKRIAAGSLQQVALKTRHVLKIRPQARIMVFERSTSRLVDFDYRGTPEQMLKRLAPPPAAPSDAEPSAQGATAPRPGRPRLGVVAREVTLLPRHWEWLNSQPGGASVSLRKLVEQAKRDHQASDSVRLAQESTYRFMSAMAGNRVGFEEAARALFGADRARFDSLLAPWPKHIREHLAELAGPVFQQHANQDGQHA